MHAGMIHEAYAKVYSPHDFMDFYHALAEEFFLLAHPSRAIPISPVPLVLDARYEKMFARLASALWETISDVRYRTLSAESIPRQLRPPDREDPEPIAFDPGNNIGCIDLHLDGGGLHMI